MAPRLRIEPIGKARCQTSLWRSHGVLRATAIVKAAFAFVDQDYARQIDARAVGQKDRHVDSNPRRSTYESFEMAPYVPGVGVTLVGVAHAPPGQTTSSMSVRLGIYEGSTPILEKTIHVFGERTRDDPRVSKPLGTMPLVFERAIGGRYNLAGSPLHNLVSPTDPSKPACFAPIPLAWRALGGRGLDPAVLKALPIEIPPGFDFEFFRSAPPDQRLDVLRGGEWILLDGMSARAPRIETRIPRVHARARFEVRGPNGWSAPSEIDLTLDTLAIDAEEELLTVLFRGNATIDESATDVLFHAGIGFRDAPLVFPPRAPGDVASGTHPSGSRSPGMPLSSTQLPESHRPASEGGGAFQTVAGTLDQIISSRGPALPFQPAPEAPRSQPDAARAIPATPWDGGAPAASDVDFAVPFAVEETMDVTAARSLPGNALPFGMPGTKVPGPPLTPALGTATGAGVGASRQQTSGELATVEGLLGDAVAGVSVEDMGTFASSNDLAGLSALPFKGAIRSAEPPATKVAPLGVPRALPFDEPAVREEPMRRPAIVEPASVAEAMATLPARISPSSRPPPLMTLGAAPAPPPTLTMLRALGLSPTAPGENTPPPAPPHASTSMPPPQIVPPPIAPTSPSTPPPPDHGPPPPAPPGAPPVAEAAAESANAAVAVLDEAGQLRFEVKKRLAAGEALRGLHLVGADLSRMDFAGKNLSGLDLSGARLDECNFKGARLSRAKLEGASLARARLEESDLEGADLRRAVLDRAQLGRAKLTGADLSHASAVDGSFEGATGRGVKLVEASLDGADFSRADLVEPDFTKARASKARFEGASLVDGNFQDLVAEGANFDRADLSRGKLERASLRRSYFIGASVADANLENADLEGVRASRAIFDRANLERATLNGAELTGASLVKAVLKGVSANRARLDGAKLEQCDLRLCKLADSSMIGASLVSAQAARADFSKADLSKADLSMANMRSARLFEANLTSAQVDQADFRDAYLARADLTGVDRESARFAGANLDGVDG